MMIRNFSKEDRKKCIPVVSQLVELSNFTREQGVSALGRRANDPDIDPLLSVAIKLIADGIDPMLVKGMLENILHTEQYEGYELLKGLIIVEGALSIQAGEIPGLFEIKLSTYLGLEHVSAAYAKEEKRKKDMQEKFHDEYRTKKAPLKAKLLKAR